MRIKRARDCSCANDWRRDYIVYFPPIASLIILVGMMASGGLNLLTVLLTTVGWVLFVYITLGYVNHLRQLKCECATSGYGDEITHFYAYLPVIGWASSIIFFIILALILSRAANGK